jgi:hypothetical protein
MSSMNAVPLAYFQVGATAIPTLLIAVAVGLKQGASHAESFKKTKGDRAVSVFTVILFSLTVGVGELAALTSGWGVVQQDGAKARFSGLRVQLRPSGCRTARNEFRTAILVVPLRSKNGSRT